MTRSYSSRRETRVPSNRQRNRQSPASERNGSPAPERASTPAAERTTSPTSEGNTLTPSRTRRSTSISRTALYADIEGYDSDGYSYHGGRTRINRRLSAVRRSEAALVERWHSSSRSRNSTYDGYDSASDSSDGEIDLSDCPVSAPDSCSPSSTGPDPGVAAVYASISPVEQAADLAELRRIYAADAEREAAAARRCDCAAPDAEPDWASILPPGRFNADGSFTAYSREEMGNLAAGGRTGSDRADRQQEGRQFDRSLSVEERDVLNRLPRWMPPDMVDLYLQSAARARGNGQQ
ncbi:hypothetical protein GE09DRAFT_1214516 [Coniochaeta sp. 2T2.1]|nr:hypothetical protein GE09DRAFT_1214516 [Coniochaeta sp. 2T2.1]